MWDIPLVPPQASSFASELDALYWIIWILTIFFTFAVAAVVAFFVIRYRRGNPVDRSNPVHHDTRIELAWSVPPLILGIAVFVWAARMYADMYSIPPNAMEVFVVGKQWMWHAQHGNGVRENNELHVPLGQPVKLSITSQDVIHSFYVPAFRVKRDAVPGRVNTCWFKPTQVGRYHLFCAEYCGTEHSLMTGWVTVMEPSDFQAWLARGGNEGKPPVSMAALGKEIWDQMACGECHGPTATVRGPSLNNLFGTERKMANGEVVKVDDNYLRESILTPNRKVTEGFEPLMADYQGQLSEEQVFQLIAYMKTLGTGAVATTPTGTPGGSAGTSPTLTLGRQTPVEIRPSSSPAPQLTPSNPTSGSPQ
jgi:cytochrome c oxidase subunit 2